MSQPVGMHHETGKMRWAGLEKGREISLDLKLKHCKHDTLADMPIELKMLKNSMHPFLPQFDKCLRELF
jgi:hypothetical protein